MSFPISPANNATTTVNGITYTYNSTESSWTRTTVVTTTGGPVTYNANTISSAITFTSGQNGLSVGPMSIISGGSVTVLPGQRWVII